MSSRYRNQPVRSMTRNNSQNEIQVKKHYFSKQNSSFDFMINKTSNLNGSMSKNNASYLSRGLSKGHSFDSLNLATRSTHNQKFVCEKKSLKTSLIMTKRTAVSQDVPSVVALKTTRIQNQNIRDLTPATDTSKTKQINNNLQQKNSMPYAKTTKNSGTNKINLNIILPQTIVAIAETETVSSDIDSSSDGAMENINISKLKIKQAEALNGESKLQKQEIISKNRRTPITSAAELNENCIMNAEWSTDSTINSCPSFTMPVNKERAPLVRAMSAPVRSMHNNLKNIGTNRRKPRRRKIPEQNSFEAKEDNENITLINGRFGDKKIYSRARSVAPSDVETLVSLIDSDGSESEKDETDFRGTRANNFTSRTGRRAPSLKKAGKSVSFQETSFYQLNSKECAHVFRRSSVVPLVARLRNNRPPSAPPVSVFIKTFNQNTTSEAFDDTIEKTKMEPVTKDNTTNIDYPVYVHTLKERECWKLYQKMCEKGIQVTFETILRGMLTPTEFRHSQKKREVEEARLKMLEAENPDVPNSIPSAYATCSESSKVFNTSEDKLTKANNK